MSDEIFEGPPPTPEANLDNEHQQRLAQRETDDAMQWLMERSKPAEEEAQPADGEGAEGQPAEEELPQDDRSIIARAASHLSPIELAGGALDAFDENFNTLRELSKSGNEFLMGGLGIPGLIVDEDGVRFTQNPDELHETDDLGGLLPDLGDKERGSFARGIGQFAGNFIGLGKAFKGLGALQGTTRAAQAGNAAVRGALGTFSGFEGMDNPINGLIEAFPSTENVVTEFLASKEEDPELLNKARNAFLDAGMGVAVDTGMYMLRAGRAALKANRGAAQVIDDVDRAAQIIDASRAEFKELLGDPDSADLILRADPAANVDDLARAATEGSDQADEVFVNWARIDSEDDVKRLIQDLANEDAPNINSARRGVQSNATTEELALQEDAWKILESRRKGDPLNAEQSVAVRKLWTASGTKTLELAQRVQAGGGAASEASFRKMLAVHATIQEQVIAARTETARALQSWRIPAGDMAQFSVGLDDLIRQTDLDPATRQLAESLTTLNVMGRTAAADQFVYAAGRMGKLQRYAANGSDMIRQLYYASLLSGPHTHMRNLIGNTGMMGLNVAERKFANVIGNSLGDAQVPDGEAGAMMFGMVQGARDAFRMSGASRAAAEAQGRVAGGLIDSIKTGDSGFGIGKVDARPVGAFSAEKLRVDPDTAWGKALDYLDTATQVPTRGLAAADEIFKTASYRGELLAQAHRQAQKELAEGTISRDVFQDRLTEIVNDPDEVMKLAAVRQAQESTFTAVPRDTGYWRAAKAVARTPVLGKILLPFSTTPYNIAIESIERLPLAPLSKKWREEIMAGGARTDIALSKMALGTMFLAASADLATSGYLTGDMRGLGETGADRAQRGRLGERSMSINVPTDDGGTRSFSFRGLDPLTFSLGIAANTVEILSADDFDDADKDGQDVAVAAVMAIAAQFTSANYMSGVSSFFEAMSDPARNSENYFERLVGPLAPTGVAQVARAVDPTIREANTWWEAVISRVPLASMALEPRVDVWGRDLSRESGLGRAYDFVSPVYSSKQDVRPIDQEMDFLGMVLGKPSKATSFDGVPINLKNLPEVYTAYVKLSGNEMKETVDGAPMIVNSIGYVSEGGGLMEELDAIVEGRHGFSSLYFEGTDGPDGDKANFVKAIVSKYRSEAKRHLVEEFPELEAELQLREGDRQERNFGPQRLRAFGQ